jgi:hypothetical protein
MWGALRPIWIPYCLPQPCIKLGTNSAPCQKLRETPVNNSWVPLPAAAVPLPAAARFVLTLSSNVCIMAGWVRGAIACRCVGARKCSTRLGRDCTPPTTAVAPLGTVIFKDDPQGSCLYSSLWPSVLWLMQPAALLQQCNLVISDKGSSHLTPLVTPIWSSVKACSPDLHLPTHLIAAPSAVCLRTHGNYVWVLVTPDYHFWTPQGASGEGGSVTLPYCNWSLLDHIHLWSFRSRWLQNILFNDEGLPTLNQPCPIPHSLPILSHMLWQMSSLFFAHSHMDF